jgi:hypothetical protein
MYVTPDNALEHARRSVEDAKQRIGEPYFQWLAWPQTWGNTACGFGGIAGQAFTDAQTVIASGSSDSVLVYHAGRFAYEVKQPTEKFWELCGQRSLPGAVEWKRRGTDRATLDSHEQSK